MSEDPILAALARLEAGQTTLRSDFSTMRSDLTTMRADLMARMDRLQHTVELVKDDITVNFASTDRVERIAKSATDETRAR